MRSQVALVVIGCIAAFACSAPTRQLDCHFVPIQSDEDEFPGCARLGNDGALVLEAEALAAVARRAQQPVALVVGSGLYYVDASGRSAPVVWYDNGPDYFEEGLARTPRGGKIGFIDRELALQIPARWDFAFPFRDGFARVCQGCHEDADGEHREVRGGLWGYIDRSGVEVVPVRYLRDELPQPPER